MTASEKILAFVRNLFDTALFFALMAWKENFRDYIRQAGPQGEPADEILLLANGPSLAEELPRLIDNRAHIRHDVLVVNYFAEDERFTTVRPKYYVLSDPTFFRRRCDWERVERLYATLNERVAWPMTLYVQYYNPDKFDYRAVLPNPLIRIVPFHTQVYRGFRALEFPCYRRGWGSGNFGSVIQNGEFIALRLGYKVLHLYGVDHTFFEGFCVDENNRVCMRRTYFYHTEPELKPLMLTSEEPPRPYTVHAYLAEKSELFRGHEVLRDYAASIGARIVNCTRGSMIDAYERPEVKGELCG
ncbi:MAG: hypothetical protein K2G10_05645 [Alistipes sp.]|nr:hypothetical protein [Alistipes sp.]